MEYCFAPDRNYQDFASGRVFYASPGQPAFPVRLASEIFQRCIHHWQESGGVGRCTLFDPTCGGAYWLIAIAFLHWDRISKIFAADIDQAALILARRNLSLLTLKGLERRISEIERMLADFGKSSHAAALKSGHVFRKTLGVNLVSHSIQTKTFQADMLQAGAARHHLLDETVDLLLADVPYGWKTDWQQEGVGPAIEHLLAAVQSVLTPLSVVAIAADKKQKFKRDGYERLEHFQVGKRRVEILRLESQVC